MGHIFIENIVWRSVNEVNVFVNWILVKTEWDIGKNPAKNDRLTKRNNLRVHVKMFKLKSV